MLYFKQLRHTQTLIITIIIKKGPGYQMNYKRVKMHEPINQMTWDGHGMGNKSQKGIK